MTYAEIADLISSTGLPSVYHHWEKGKAPPLPYLVFYYDSRSDFKADNRNYQKIVSVTLELYSERKNFAAEEAVEAVLEKNSIPYTKEETYIESECMFENIYEFEILLDGMQREERNHRGSSGG